MRPTFTRARSEVRRRRLQSAVIVVMVALASGTIMLGSSFLRFLNAHPESSEPGPRVRVPVFVEV